jgi:hypothetical protein
MTDRKKPGVAFWATVGLVVVLVGYPLSFGPAYWLVDRRLLPIQPVVKAYRPLGRISTSIGIPGLLWWCADWCTLPGNAKPVYPPAGVINLSGKDFRPSTWVLLHIAMDLQL